MNAEPKDRGDSAAGSGSADSAGRGGSADSAGRGGSADIAGNADSVGSAESAESAESDGGVAPHVLRNYALLADGERAAVIGPTGEIAWMCFPGWADQPLFTSLLGGPSSYTVRPRRRYVWGGQYEEGSLIWRNRWMLVGGHVLECAEVLAYPGRTDRAVLVRRPMAEDAPEELEIRLDLRDGDRSLTGLQEVAEGVFTARFGALHMRWQVPCRLEWRDGCAHGVLALEAGEHADLILELSVSAFDDDPPEGDTLLRDTRTNWQRRTPELVGSAAPRDARHSVAVLNGLTSGSGAMVAACTTSLPERAEAGWDYDYRYAWIRDQCYTGLAGAATGVDTLVDPAVRFVHERILSDGENLRPAYTVGGDPIPEQSPIDLPGYPGTVEVRSGNRAGAQFQLDVFGEALNLFAAAARSDRLSPEAHRAAEVAASAVEKRWGDPGAGVWELDQRWWTHSRLVCVAGLRAMASVITTGERASRYLSLADTILAETSRRAVHREGYWQRAPDDERVDASLLLAAIRGALPADDPRSLATMEAVKAQLCSDGYVYRFRAGDEPLGHAEGAFLVCGYWLAQAELASGDSISAVRAFERNRAACGPAGIFSEEYDVHQRQLRGNFPQAFVHAELLHTAGLIGEST